MGDLFNLSLFFYLLSDFLHQKSAINSTFIATLKQFDFA